MLSRRFFRMVNNTDKKQKHTVQQLSFFPKSEPAPILWLMGPTSAGKSTIAEHLVDHLRGAGGAAIHLDGDQVRGYFGDLIRFADKDRLRVVETLADLAGRTSEAGLTTVVAALTAQEDARRYVRQMLPDVIVIHVDCPIDVCMERDPKGLYRKAIDGEIETLIGYNEPYHPPQDPDMTIDTNTRSIDDGVTDILDKLARTRQEPR